MIALWIPLFLYVGWLLFIVYGGARVKWNTLNHKVRVLLLPAGAVGFAMDVVFQWTLASLLLLDIPKELTFTQRLERLKAGPDGWRKSAAAWFCANVLDPFDAGHC